MSKNPPRGRPKKPDRFRKVEYLDVRLTADEKAAFAIAAEIAGIPVSSWARERLRYAASRELESARRPVPFLKHSLD